MPVLFFENCGDISTMGHKGPCDSQKYPQIQQKLRYPKNLVTVNHAFRDMLPGQFIASRDVRVGHRGFMDLFLCQMFLLACSYASDRTTKSQQISNSIRQMYQVLSDFFLPMENQLPKLPGHTSKWPGRSKCHAPSRVTPEMFQMLRVCNEHAPN